MAEWMPVLVAQAWQVTLLIVAVAAINRCVGNNRSHLAHALWLVVLVKCVTPPVWSSPSGLFCWLQPAREAMQEPLTAELSSRSWSELVAAARDPEKMDVVTREEVESDVGPEEWLIGLGENSNPVMVLPLPATTGTVDWPRVLLGAWALASLIVIAVAVVRWGRCWRMLQSTPRRECAELSSQLDLLAKKLGLRRRVRLIVTESRLGPAVIGLFRTTVLLPALIVDRLLMADASFNRKPQAHASANDPANARACGLRINDQCNETAEGGHPTSPLAPILAHELLHVRRGDLWVGLLQTLAQAVWWCHPLVWWVNRRTTREAERCCDEEVLAELGCDPAAYARALVDVLELKRELKPVPVFPGVRPVEVTTQRLERIMQLGQGCQRRTPWWCWLLAGLAAAATWPGAAFVVTAEDDDANVATENEKDADAIELAIAPDGSIDLDKEPKLELAYRVRVLRGPEDHLQPLVKKLNEKLLAKPGEPVIVEHDDVLKLLMEAQENRHLNLRHPPVARSRGNKEVSIGDMTTFTVPVQVVAEDGTPTVYEQSREHGWRLTMGPKSVGLELLRLHVVNEVSRLNNAAAVKVQDRTTGEEKLIPGLDVQRINTTVNLKRAQHVVFPIAKVPDADSHDVMLVMMQAGLFGSEESPQQPEPNPADLPEPSIRRGVGVNSDEGVTGQIVFEEADDRERPAFPEMIPDGDIAEIRVEGNRSISTEKVLEMINSKSGEPLDGAQLRKDVQAIYSSRQFYSVKPRIRNSDKGPILIFQVNEGLKLMQLEFQGNKRIKTAELAKLTGLRVGERLAHADNREAARKIVEHYQAKGFSQAKAHAKLHVKIEDNPNGQKVAGLCVVFVIDEGPKVIVGDVKFDPAGNKLELDSLGQLLWQHGSWFLVVRPEPGAKLIESVDAPTAFDSDGPIKLMMTQVQIEGFDRKNQISISADKLMLATNENGQHMQLSGSAKMSGHEFNATADQIQLTLSKSPDFVGHDISASLLGTVTVSRKSKGELSELSAEKALFVVRGSSISQLEHDQNGVTAILRQPHELDAKLVQRHQEFLGKTPVEKLVSIHFDAVPLKAALQQLAKASGRNIHLDQAGLAEESLTETVPVTLNLDQVKLSTAMNLLLDPLNLGYRIEESGVIVVTSQQRVKGHPIIATYSVADLAVPVPKRVSIKLNAKREMAGDEFKPSEPAKSMSLPPQELADLIMSTCQPNSWEEVGGAGSIKVNAKTLSLVVRQTRDVHDEIRDLLGQLRRLQQKQVVLQIEAWTVPNDFWERLRKLDVDLQDFPLPDSKSPAERLALQGFPTNRLPMPGSNPLVDAPLLRLAVLLRKEAKLLGSVCQTKLSPKMTLFNGQELELVDGLNSPPTRLILKPVVFDELKRMRLHSTVMKPGDVDPDVKPDFTKCAVALEAEHAILLDVFPQKFSVVEESSTTLSLNGITTKSLGQRNVDATDRTLLLITGAVVTVEEKESLLGIPD